MVQSVRACMYTWFRIDFHPGMSAFLILILLCAHSHDTRMKWQVIPVFNPNENLVHEWYFILGSCKLGTNIIRGWKRTNRKDWGELHMPKIDFFKLSRDRFLFFANESKPVNKLFAAIVIIISTKIFQHGRHFCLNISRNNKSPVDPACECNTGFIPELNSFRSESQLESCEMAFIVKLCRFKVKFMSYKGIWWSIKYKSQIRDRRNRINYKQ